MKRNGLTWKIILPILLLLLGGATTALLVKSRSAPTPTERIISGPLVDVVPVRREDHRVVVRGTGSVRARRQAEITPQVGGKVVRISSRLVEGGFFSAGEELFALESIDYELALERARANLAQAGLELERTRSLAEVARREWERLPQATAEEPTPLTLYQPQLKNAEAQLAAAEAGVRQAELDLARTVVSAPFDAYVRSEQVDLGQILRAGTPVGILAGTDTVEIVVPLPLEDLRWLQIPRRGEATAGSPARVILELGPQQHSWTGAVVRSHGEVDPQSRMAKLVIAVADPFGRTADNAPGHELAPGMFVEVLLQGDTLEDVIAIPRAALRDHDTVWVATADDTLAIRPVEIVRREREQILVRSGIVAGERLVLTGLTAAAEGMQLRPQLLEETP